MTVDAGFGFKLARQLPFKDGNNWEVVPEVLPIFAKKELTPATGISSVVARWISGYLNLSNVVSGLPGVPSRLCLLGASAQLVLIVATLSNLLLPLKEDGT